MKINRPGVLRHLHARAGQTIAVAQIEPLARLRRIAELRGLLMRQGIQLFDLGDDPEDLLRLAFRFLFGQLFLIELNDFLN